MKLSYRREALVGATRAKILLRDQGRAFEHFIRGGRSHFDGDTLTFSARWVRGQATVAGERDLRVVLHPHRVLSPWLSVARQSVEARLRDYVDDVFGSRIRDYDRKVFCIGFQRTGTTTLVEALRKLGLFAIHGAPWLLDDARRGHVDDQLFRDYHAFADNPLPLLYRELDQRYPGSLFILTHRDPEAWLASVHWLVTGTGRGYPMERWIYGTRRFDRRRYLERYERHNRDVLTYFRGRRDLLVLDLSRGDGWAPLCDFLGLPRPAAPFPHRGRRGSTDWNLPGPLHYGPG